MTPDDETHFTFTRVDINTLFQVFTKFEQLATGAQQKAEAGLTWLVPNPVLATLTLYHHYRRDATQKQLKGVGKGCLGKWSILDSFPIHIMKAPNNLRMHLSDTL